MILLADATGSDEILELLKATRGRILELIAKHDDSTQDLNATIFEKLVFDVLKEEADAQKYKGEIKYIGGGSFPDVMVDNRIGVEVKFTSQDHWTTIGNSVMESRRADDAGEIFVFFGKFGGKPDIKIREYSEVVTDVKVTHSPRYSIDMEAKNDDTLFKKIGKSYDDIKDNPIPTIKKYLLSTVEPGEELWWTGATDEKVTSAKLIKFTNLPSAEQSAFIGETFVLFPGVLGEDKNKFAGPAAYLITSKGANSSNFRDNFSAGGTVEMLIGEKIVEVPQIIYRLCSHAKHVRDALEYLDEDMLLKHWGLTEFTEEKEEHWRQLVMKHDPSSYGGFSAFEIYQRGVSGHCECK